MGDGLYWVGVGNIHMIVLKNAQNMNGYPNTLIGSSILYHVHSEITTTYAT